MKCRLGRPLHRLLDGAGAEACPNALNDGVYGLIIRAGVGMSTEDKGDDSLTETEVGALRGAVRAGQQHRALVKDNRQRSVIAEARELQRGKKLARFR